MSGHAERLFNAPEWTRTITGKSPHKALNSGPAGRIRRVDVAAVLSRTDVRRPRERLRCTRGLTRDGRVV